MYDHRVAGRRVFQQEKIQTLWKYGCLTENANK